MKFIFLISLLFVFLTSNSQYAESYQKNRRTTLLAPGSYKPTGHLNAVFARIRASVNEPVWYSILFSNMNLFAKQKSFITTDKLHQCNEGRCFADDHITNFLERIEKYRSELNPPPPVGCYSPEWIRRRHNLPTVSLRK